MKKGKLGFTLIEISFFLAITGALFVSIIVGTQNSIWQQKYNDSVQNFANFLRSAYSQVSNPQGDRQGRSDQAIYGKLIVFGEEYDFKGDKIPNGEQRIFIYDLVGDATAVSTGSIIETFKALHINVVVEEKVGDTVLDVSTAGLADSYVPTWSAVIEKTAVTAGQNNNFIGAIMIVRHPRSGVINTLISTRKMNINSSIKAARGNGNFASLKGLITDKLNIQNYFKVEQLDLCVNPYGEGEVGPFRRDIRIVSNARNASGVEIVDQDDSENACKK